MQIEIPIQHDVWMRNGVENLFRLIEDIDGCSVKIENNSLKIETSDHKKFLRNFENRIKQRQNEIIFIKKTDNKGQMKYVKKDFILMQYGKASGGRNILKEKIYSQTEKRLNEIFSNLEEGNKTCVICGRKFKKPVDKLKQSVYPFVTKIKSLSGVRTLKENYDNLCPMCYLIGTLEWLDEGIIYRSLLGGGQTYSIVFLPFEFDVEKLHESKKEYIEILGANRDSQVSNLLKIIKTRGEERRVGYEGEFTTILKFFEKFVEKILGEYREEEIELDELLEKVERRLCKSWILVKVPGQRSMVKNVKYQRLDLKDEILELITKFERKKLFIYNNVIDKIGIKAQGLSPQQKNKIISEKKESMAKYVLKNNFRNFSRVFLPKKNKVIYFGDLRDLDELIKLWRLRKMGLESEVENLKSAGKCLAILIKNHLSILYSMDKARTKEEFIRALEQASKRLVGLVDKKRVEIYPPSLETVTDSIIKSDGDKWQTIRDVLLIYTIISLSRIEYKERGDKK